VRKKRKTEVVVIDDCDGGADGSGSGRKNESGGGESAIENSVLKVKRGMECMGMTGAKALVMSLPSTAPTTPTTTSVKLESKSEDTSSGKLESESQDTLHSPSSQPPPPDVNPRLLVVLREHVEAYLLRTEQAKELEAIEPLPEDSKEGVECAVCCDNFEFSDCVPCDTTKGEIHFLCKSCFHGYATITIKQGGLGSIACPLGKECGAFFAVADVRRALAKWDILAIQRREEKRCRKVALAAKAVLYCVCGALAVITEEDFGNGVVQCPGSGSVRCEKRYCCKCGNDAHPSSKVCPPTAETMEWLDKHTKQCPNCHEAIQKGGGCDHMVCAPPGGCGYEFWFTCGCPYKGKHREGCKKEGEALGHGQF